MRRKKCLVSILVLGLLLNTLTSGSQTIVVRGDKNYPPFEFIGSDGKPDGFNVDLFKAIMEAENMHCDIQLHDWDSVIAGFLYGTTNVITGTTDGHTWIGDNIFGIPYFQMRLSITSRKSDKYELAEQLIGKTIIVQNLSFGHKFLMENKITDNIVIVEKLDEAFKQLSKGLVDAVMCDDIAAKYTIKQNKFRGLHVHPTSLGYHDYSFVLHKEDQELRHQLNKGLYTIKINGTYDDIYKKWFDKYDKKDTNRTILLSFLIAIGVALMLFIFTIYLRNRIKVATLQLKSSQDSLREKNYELQIAMSAGQIFPFSWDIAKDRAYITIPESKEIPAFAHSSQGLKLDEFVNNVHPDEREKCMRVLRGIIEGKVHNTHLVTRYDATGKYESYFDFYVSSENIENGKPTKAIGFIQDVTRRIVDEQLLRKSQDFLIEILNDIPFPIFVTDVENGYKYNYWNNKATEQYHVDGLDKTMDDILSPEVAIRLKSVIKYVFESGKDYSEQEPVTLLDGSTYNTLANISRISFGDKQYVLSVRWNIDEILALQHDIEEANRRNEMILDNINSGLVYLTPDYTVLWENISKIENMKSIHRFHVDEICHLRASGSTYPCEECPVRMALESKQTVTVEKEFEEGKFFDLMAVPILDKYGAIEGVILRVDDISEKKRINLQLEEAKEAAIQADKLKSVFLANMSHEIRTPLNAIVGFAQLIKDSNSEEEKEEYSNIITTSSDNLLRLINDILDLSKIEAGFIELQNITFDLSKLMNVLATTLRQRVQEGVELIAEIPYQFCTITGDKNRITQVINNFATNSIKFTKSGSITMGYEVIDIGVRVYVKDTGIGIEESKKSKVFERFEKLNNVAQGTGLGLSICKTIVETAGGQIGFESEFGKGSTFWATFPTSVAAE